MLERGPITSLSDVQHGGGNGGGGGDGHGLAGARGRGGRPHNGGESDEARGQVRHNFHERRTRT